MKTKFRSILLALATLIAAESHAATRTWTGLGLNPFWDNPGNWAGGIRPAVTDDVAFPPSAPVVATVNNWIGAVNSITFGGGGYSISGNSLILTNGITATNTSGVNAVAVNIVLGANQSFTNLNAGAELVLVSLDLHGRSATFRGAGANLISNVIMDIAGGGRLTNSGTGLFLLTGTNSSFTGQTVLNSGTNLLNSFHWRSPITWMGGSLGGTGVLGQVTASGATAKLLTAGFRGTGILTTSNLVLNSSVTNVMRINGLTPGRDYDQLVVSNGNLTAGSATLNLSPTNNFAPSFGDTVTLIKLVNPTNTITGTFANLPEGSTFTNNSSIYRLSYAGGDGNDVTLTVAGFATGNTKSWAGAGTNSLWMNRTNWSLNIAPVQGDALTFPAIGVLRTTNVNDFPTDTTFDSLFFVAPASAVLKDTISGNAIRLNNGVKVAPAAPAALNASGTVVISNRLSLNFSQAFTNVVDADVHFVGSVELGLNTLSVGVRDGLPDIFFDGTIGGAGQFETTGDGTVTLNASNAITGNIFVNRGILVVQHARALGRVTDGPVQVGANGTLRLAASNAIFTGSSIVLTGRLEAASPGSTLTPSLVVAGSSAVITNFSGLSLQGSISNGTQLTLSGSGISRLDRKGLIRGSGLLKNSGHLQADAFIQNVVQLGIGSSSGTLSGTGNVNTVVCTNTTCIIAPGSPTDATNAVGALTFGSLILSSGATLQMDLLGNKHSDSIITSNAPTLGNATLTLKTLTNLAPNQTFFLIRNDSAAPVTNTFANLPEGAFLGAINGNFGLQISYLGGNGNDVVVTVQSNTPPLLTLASRFVNEQNLLTFTNSAVDFDQPPQALTWGLVSAPAGVNLNSSSGVLTWTPTVAQGPSTMARVNRVTVCGVGPRS
jgi:autotransporter-associated beta strand protein